MLQFCERSLLPPLKLLDRVEGSWRISCSSPLFLYPEVLLARVELRQPRQGVEFEPGPQQPFLAPKAQEQAAVEEAYLWTIPLRRQRAFLYYSVAYYFFFLALCVQMTVSNNNLFPSAGTNYQEAKSPVLHLSFPTAADKLQPLAFPLIIRNMLFGGVLIFETLISAVVFPWKLTSEKHPLAFNLPQQAIKWTVMDTIISNNIQQFLPGIL